MKQKYNVMGMTCSACSERIEKAVSGLTGTYSVDVDLLNAAMVVEFDDNLLSHEVILDAVEKAGYKAVLPGGVQTTLAADVELNALKKRMVISVCLLIPLLYVSLQGYFGFSDTVFFRVTENIFVTALLQLVFALPILILNRKCVFSGIKSLTARDPNTDSLIAVSSMAAVIYGLFNIILLLKSSGDSVGNLCFSYAGVTLTLVSVGEFIETRSIFKTREAVSALEGFSSATVRVFRDIAEVEIPLSDLIVGDLVIIEPGDRICVDGIITEGHSFVDQSLLTGDSAPTEKCVGDRVLASSINKTDIITVRAEHVGEDSTYYHLMRFTEDNGISMTSTKTLPDKICGVFVPAVLVIALADLIIWLNAGYGTEFALPRALAVLTISCPFAIGIAAPLAAVFGISKGTEFGIQIIEPEVFETAGQIDTVVLDKTGTVTTGELRITDIVSLTDNSQFLSLAAAAARRYKHPMASAIIEKGRCLESEKMFVSDQKVYDGLGLRTVIDDKVYYIGNLALMKQKGIRLGEYAATGIQLESEGKTVMFFAQEKEDKLLGIIAAADTLKSSAKLAVSELCDQNLEVCLLTGDNEKTANNAAAQLGIDRVVAGVMPQDKLALIRSLQARGKRVMVVGDGINDVPSIVSADIGVALGNGDASAVNLADAVLIRNDPLDVVRLIALGRAVRRNIKINLLLALVFNCLCLPVAAGVFYPLSGIQLTPVAGLAPMILGLLCVIANSLRLRKFTPK